MDQEMERAVRELVDRLDRKGFFEKYCGLVCPQADEGICGKCPYSKREIMELWATQPEVDEMVHRSDD